MLDGYDNETPERRDALNALRNALEVFTAQSEETFVKTMTTGCGFVVDIIGLDRLSVWRNSLKSDGLHSSQVYRWIKESGGTAEPLGILVDVTYAQLAPRWEEVLAAGDSINGLARLMPEVTLLQSLNCVSLFVNPIFVCETFWGFVLFEDRGRERVFTEDEANILRSASLMLANTVNRYDEADKTRKADERVKLALKEVVYRDQMLNAVNRAADLLLKADEGNFEASLIEGIELVANCADIDRVNIWQNEKLESVNDFCLMYTWANSHAQHGLPLYKGLRFPYSAEWKEIFLRYENINSPVSRMSPKDRDMLSPYEMKSILIIPLFFQDRFWGHITFDDCRRERVFSENEISILRSASMMMINAAIRNEETAKVREAEERTRLMLDSTPLCCQIWDKKFRTIDCNEAGVKLYGFKDKHEYIARFSECSPEYQIDGQRSSEKLAMNVQIAFSEGYCFFEWMHQMPDGVPVPAEVTLVRVKYGDDFAVAGYTKDLRHIKAMEKNILYLEKEVDKIYYDALTGIYNRRFFDKNIKRLINTLSRSNGMLSLLMIDIDFFKMYNDTYGHINGDNCLRTVAETLTNTITRADDFVARYGGEEFVVVLPNTDENGAQTIAEKMLENVRNCGIPHETSDAAHCVTISIGATAGQTVHTHSEEEYIQRADEMLYKSKQGGRDRYTFGSL